MPRQPLSLEDYDALDFDSQEHSENGRTLHRDGEEEPFGEIYIPDGENLTSALNNGTAEYEPL